MEQELLIYETFTWSILQNRGVEWFRAPDESPDTAWLEAEIARFFFAISARNFRALSLSISGQER